MQSLKILDFSHNILSGQNTINTAETIGKNRLLEHLDISNCELNEVEFLKICSGLANIQTIKVLNVNGNNMTESLSDYIAMIIANNPNLKGLSLSSCNLQQYSFKKISESLHTLSSLNKLDVSYNSIDDEMGCSLADVIASNYKLNSLNLSHCCLHDIGIAAVFQALNKHTKFKFIDLKCNQLSKMNNDVLTKFIANNELLEHLC